MALNRRLIDDSIKLGTEDAIKRFLLILGALFGFGLLALGLYALFIWIAVSVLH
jgi:hypothetical protein